MEQKLISKKELLSRYRISYGALYRWKRKGLIPEEWFIKKTTVTGQETYFPEALICERVALILEQKDDVLLDELSKQLSAETQNAPALILETVYGKKIIYFKDIKSVFVDLGDGESKDITEMIRGGNG